jgi:hypothetical protein
VGVVCSLFYAIDAGGHADPQHPTMLEMDNSEHSGRSPSSPPDLTILMDGWQLTGYIAYHSQTLLPKKQFGRIRPTIGGSFLPASFFLAHR